MSKLGKVGPYTLLERLGRGGMGEVYLAGSRRGERVALKVLHELAQDDSSRIRLEREVRALRRVESPYVAKVLDADLDCARPYLVMENIEGVTLLDRVRQDGPLDMANLVDMAQGIAAALAIIHAAGVVHRDLKPANIIMGAEGPVLIDFGIAQVHDATRLTLTGTFLGTPGYTAPEVFADEPVESPADIHAWAATVAFAATGRPAFGRGTPEAQMYAVLNGQADLKGVPVALLPLVRAALNREPAKRPTAALLADRLSRLARVTGRSRSTKASKGLLAAPVAEDTRAPAADDAHREDGRSPAPRGRAGGDTGPRGRSAGDADPRTGDSDPRPRPRPGDSGSRPRTGDSGSRPRPGDSGPRLRPGDSGPRARAGGEPGSRTRGSGDSGPRTGDSGPRPRGGEPAGRAGGDAAARGRAAADPGARARSAQDGDVPPPRGRASADGPRTRTGAAGDLTPRPRAGSTGDVTPRSRTGAGDTTARPRSGATGDTPRPRTGATGDVTPRPRTGGGGEATPRPRPAGDATARPRPAAEVARTRTAAEAARARTTGDVTPRPRTTGEAVARGRAVADGGTRARTAAEGKVPAPRGRAEAKTRGRTAEGAKPVTARARAKAAAAQARGGRAARFRSEPGTTSLPAGNAALLLLAVLAVPCVVASVMWPIASIGVTAVFVVLTRAIWMSHWMVRNRASRRWRVALRVVLFPFAATGSAVTAAVWPGVPVVVAAGGALWLTGGGQIGSDWWQQPAPVTAAGVVFGMLCGGITGREIERIGARLPELRREGLRALAVLGGFVALCAAAVRAISLLL
ncbi:serine/threonine protein kinase [Nonomuraea roseoviolacea]|uniref:non-specific serine/threonine protein kinase n=1 Tax=Nonomuraea roseoviolacea subsp. carminata TaxID=160689 RepID=A0ABT1K675_9ACTN|nr:serine/threonine protein kinase [Nonomuraea roseoviolacea]MCP2349503.1 serine/threonine protein kinase [Nonomuraea roseoviolacea subsp. carminata]